MTRKLGQRTRLAGSAAPIGGTILQMPASRCIERDHNGSRCLERATRGTEAAGQGARHSRGSPVRGDTLTVFCCFCLDGCDVGQRVGELLAAGPKRRRLVNIADPVGLLLSEIEDGRLALQKRHDAVSRQQQSDKQSGA